MKKRYLFLNLALCLVSLTLIPLNMFVLTFSNLYTVLSVLLCIASLVLFFLRSKARITPKLLGSLLTIVVAIVMLFASFCNPFWNSVNFREKPKTVDGNTIISSSEAVGDIDFVAKYLEKVHPLCANGLPINVRTIYESEREKLESAESVSVYDLYESCSAMLAPLSDGHTAIYDRFPERRYLEYDCHDLLRVGGKTIDELFEENKDKLSFETDDYGKFLIQDLLTELHGARYLGLDLSVPVEYVFSGENGSEYIINVTEADFIPSALSSKHNVDIEYNIDEERSLAVLTLRQCNFNDEYIKTLCNMFNEIKDRGIQNIAVDLRGNGGGTSRCADEFIRYLDTESYYPSEEIWRFGFLNIRLNSTKKLNNKYSDLTFGGNVYVITSVETYSAATQFAQYIKFNNLGTVIGEASGNTTECFGEVITFMLPSSRLYFSVSSAHMIPLGENVGKIVTPDISCHSTEAIDVLYRQISAS